MKSKKIVVGILIFVILIIIFINFYYYYSKEVIDEDEIAFKKLSAIYEENISVKEDKGYIIEDKKDSITNEELVTKNGFNTIDGYEVIAKLEIPKINLVTYVLSETTEKSLKISVTKFWGPNPNEVGNFCIAGHNFVKRDNMFKNVKKLSIGDEIYLIDSSGKRLKYTVYDTLSVEPHDTNCVSQKTDGKKELTLITCNATSSLRIIVKAVQI